MLGLILASTALVFWRLVLLQTMLYGKTSWLPSLGSAYGDRRVQLL